MSATETQTSFQAMTVREVQVPHARIRYREAGEGRPIVFLHGVLVNGGLWRKVAPKFTGTNRVIVPDWPLGSHELPLEHGVDVTLPGLARMVADFLAALDLQDVVLVANDTGGAIAQQLVVDHPERVGALVLTPCDSHDHFFPPVFKPLIYMSYLPGFAWTMAQAMRLQVVRKAPFAMGWVVKHDVPEDATLAQIAPLQRHRSTRRDITRIVRRVSSSYTQALLPRLREFDKPVLIAWAGEDKLFPLANAQDLAKRFPNARFETIEDSYTFVPEDQPERLAELIADFVSA